MSKINPLGKVTIMSNAHAGKYMITRKQKFDLDTAVFSCSWNEVAVTEIQACFQIHLERAYS